MNRQAPQVLTCPRRKRLLWQSNHRGIKEMDILMGGFASARLAHMTEAELDEFEKIIAIPDQQLLAWFVGDETVPSSNQSPLLNELLRYRPL